MIGLATGLNEEPTLLVHCLYQMSPLNHKRTTSSLAPPIFYAAKKWQLKDRRLPTVRFKPLNRGWATIFARGPYRALNLLHGPDSSQIWQQV